MRVHVCEECNYHSCAPPTKTGNDVPLPFSSKWKTLLVLVAVHNVEVVLDKSFK